MNHGKKFPKLSQTSFSGIAIMIKVMIHTALEIEASSTNWKTRVQAIFMQVKCRVAA